MRRGLLDIVCPAAQHEIRNPETKLWKRKRQKGMGETVKEASNQLILKKYIYMSNNNNKINKQKERKLYLPCNAINHTMAYLGP